MASLTGDQKYLTLLISIANGKLDVSQTNSRGIGLLWLVILMGPIYSNLPTDCDKLVYFHACWDVIQRSGITQFVFILFWVKPFKSVIYDRSRDLFWRWKISLVEYYIMFNYPTPSHNPPSKTPYMRQTANNCLGVFVDITLWLVWYKQRRVLILCHFALLHSPTIFRFRTLRGVNLLKIKFARL